MGSRSVTGKAVDLTGLVADANVLIDYAIWGLEALALAVEAGHLTAKRAMSVAEKISTANPFITAELLARFRSRIAP